MKQNAGYWEMLKKKLLFLSQNNSIEIKKVDFKINDENEGLFSVQVNGVIMISKNEYDVISNKISSIVEKCIK